jgi:tetratricopeptide (TPR) repeat protein
MSIERGTLLYRTGRHDLAEQEFRAALAAEPSSALAHAMIGLCLLHRERFDDAAAEARQAIQLRPDWDVGYATLAAVLVARHRLGEAAEAVGRAIALDPFDPDHHGTLAGILLQQRRWADALAAADAGLAIDPSHPACVNARGMALVQLGRRDEASVTLGGALARDPHSAVTHANQGWTLLHAGDHRAALEHFREALRIDPGQDWAKAGIVEALKARHLIYRVMLRYFLFMSRMSRQVQWGVLLGGYFGYRLAAAAADDHPAVRPYLLPVMVAYVAFAVMTWLAGPAFNLMLRVDRFGRYALSRDQRVASNLFGLCLLTAAALAIAWAVTRDQRYLIAAMVAGLLSIPVTSAFRLTAGWPRWAMAATAGALALTGGAFVGFVFFGGPSVAGLAGTLGWGFIYGMVGGNLLANALAGVQVRR